MRVRTLPELVQRAVHDHGPRTALRYEREGDWHPVTYAQMGRLVEQAAAGLVARGVEPGQRVALVAARGPQPAIADLAILHAGAVCVPLDAGSPPEAKRAAIEQADPEVVFLPRQPDPDGWLPSGPLAILLEAGGDADHVAEEDQAPSRLTMAGLYREGQGSLGEDGDLVQDRWRDVEPSDPAAYVPAAGGAGRAVDVPHERIVDSVRRLASLLDADPGDRTLSLLPLSQPLERVLGHYACYHHGGEKWFPRSAETLAEDLRVCRPELLVASGEGYGRLRGHLEERLEASPETQRRLFAWARGLGEQTLDAHRSEGTPSIGLRLRSALAERLVLAKARTELGLGDLEAAAVPVEELRSDVSRWLASLGVPLLGLYAPPGVGAIVAARRWRDAAPGCLGRPLGGIQVRVDGDDGTQKGGIEVRVDEHAGSSGSPETEGDAAGDGWLATGDVGRLDEDGLLYLEETG